jgi:MFS family permease
MTVYNLAATVGGAAGLLSGGLLTRAFGWRGVFALTSVLAVALAGSALLTRTRRRTSAVGIDGAVTAASVADLPATRRALTRALLANLLVYVNFSVFVVSLPLYAADRFNASAERIATLLLAITAAHFVAAVPAGRAVRLWGADRALAIGLLGAAVGMALVLPSPNELVLAVPLMLYSVGQVFGTTAAGDLLLRLGGRGGRAVGLVRFSSDVGLVIGPAAVGVLADVAGNRAPFIALAALTVVVAAAAWRMPGAR